jgi:hypothetical protein
MRLMRDWIWFVCLALGSALSAWALPAVTVLVDGQAEVAPVPRALWEGQHMAFSLRLLKSHELELLRYIPIRLVRTHDSDISLDLISLGPGTYDFTPLDRFLDDLIELSASETSPGLLMNLEFTPRWLAEDACPERAPRYNRPKDWGLWAQVVEDTVRHIRQRAPGIDRYYEVWNEPNTQKDGFWMPCEPDPLFARQQYFRLYKEAALAVQRADPDAQVGGPNITLDDDDEIVADWMTSFLDYCQDNAVPLHFVSYHRYDGATPRIDTEDALSVRRWLAERNLPDVEILNTEWSLFGGLAPPSAAAEAMYGAVIPARVFSMSKGGVNRSVYSAEPLPTQELILPDEQVRPTYNVFRMLDVLKGIAVAAESDGLDDDGTGVGVFAASDRAENALAILIWNYRYTAFTAPPATINLDVRRLPDYLRRTPLTYRRYLVDATTSNWMAASSQDHLQEVEAGALPPSSNFTAGLTLEPNAVTLLVLCRQDGACPDLFSPGDYLGPAISSVFVDAIAFDSATVTWSTDRAATSKVEYGTSLDYALGTGTNTTLTTEHTMMLKDLAPNTTYYFRVVSVDSAGRQSTSEDWWFFKTPARGHITWVFKPTDNTYTDDQVCNKNPELSFSTARLLGVRHTSQRAFLRFDVGSIANNGSVTAAELCLFAVDYGDHGGVLYQTRETNWRESDVNCFWQPRLVNPPLGSGSNQVANGFTYCFTVTPAVLRDGIFSFAITQPLPWAKVAYTSTRHGYNPPPMLFVTVSEQEVVAKAAFKCTALDELKSRVSMPSGRYGGRARP